MQAIYEVVILVMLVMWYGHVPGVQTQILLFGSGMPSCVGLPYDWHMLLIRCVLVWFTMHADDGCGYCGVYGIHVACWQC
jgi:hypothetical protein